MWSIILVEINAGVLFFMPLTFLSDWVFCSFFLILGIIHMNFLQLYFRISLWLAKMLINDWLKNCLLRRDVYFYIDCRNVIF